MEKGFKLQLFVKSNHYPSGNDKGNPDVGCAFENLAEEKVSEGRREDSLEVEEGLELRGVKTKKSNIEKDAGGEKGCGKKEEREEGGEGILNPRQDRNDGKKKKSGKKKVKKQCLGIFNGILARKLGRNSR